MGYNLKNEPILIGAKRRIFFKSKNLRIFIYPIALFICFFTVLSFALPALAIETTKASALYLEEQRQAHTLSHTANKAPHSKTAKPCQLSLNAPAKATAFSPKANRYGDASYPSSNFSSHKRNVRNSAPLALAAYLGVRVALGSTQAANGKGRVQFRSNVQLYDGGHSDALAIAAYRHCQKERTLSKFHSVNYQR